MTDTEYLTVMLAKLLDALARKDTERDGNWGYPSFHAEIEEMRKSIAETKAVKEYTGKERKL